MRRVIGLLLLLLSSTLTSATQIGSFQVQVDSAGVLKSVNAINEDNKSLNLSSLELGGIDTRAFDNVTDITSLDLSDNKLSGLPEDVFSKLVDLERLSLASNSGNIQLKRHFSTLSKLKSLDLSKSKGLVFLFQAFVGLPDDAEIKITGGLFYLMPSMFNLNETMQVGRQNLLSKNCTDQNYSYDIARKKGEMFRSKPTNETTLCLTNGTVNSFGTDDENCTSHGFKSEYAVFVSTGIKAFEKDWFKLPIQYDRFSLAFKNNSFTEIDENLINDLPQSIDCVIIVENKIKIVKSSIISNINLKNLDLSKNAIETIEDDAFRNLPSLLVLYLSDNDKINNLRFISGISNTLRTLDLSRNNISHIPENTFSHLTELRVLQLAKNKVKVLSEKTFSKLPQLTYLSFESNGIERIHKDPFNELPCLQRLDFSFNEIKFIERGFANNLNNLNELRIGWCVNVTKLEKGLFYGLPTSAVVHAPEYLRLFQPGLFKKY